jgi:hypothetical protein
MWAGYARSKGEVNVFDYDFNLFSIRRRVALIQVEIDEDPEAVTRLRNVTPRIIPLMDQLPGVARLFVVAVNGFVKNVIGLPIEIVGRVGSVEDHEISFQVPVMCPGLYHILGIVLLQGIAPPRKFNVQLVEGIFIGKNRSDDIGIETIQPADDIEQVFPVLGKLFCGYFSAVPSILSRVMGDFQMQPSLFIYPDILLTVRPVIGTGIPNSF